MIRQLAGLPFVSPTHPFVIAFTYLLSSLSLSFANNRHTVLVRPGWNHPFPAPSPPSPHPFPCELSVSVPACRLLLRGCPQELVYWPEVWMTSKHFLCRGINFLSPLPLRARRAGETKTVQCGSRADVEFSFSTAWHGPPRPPSLALRGVQAVSCAIFA